MTWHKRAACRGAPIGMFYTEPGRHPLEAREICDTCPVEEPCLEHALRHEDFGIWAGTTPNERRLIRHQRGITLETPNHEAEPPVCGTRNGYLRHRRNNETACEGCLDASREYSRRLYAARKNGAA